MHSHGLLLVLTQRTTQQASNCSPPELLAGYYWYGPRKYSAGKIPHWVTTLNVDNCAGITTEETFSGYRPDESGTKESVTDNISSVHPTTFEILECHTLL